MCEHAYSLAQNLDPNSEGRGVLQFKTGLMSVIKVPFHLRYFFLLDLCIEARGGILVAMPELNSYAKVKHGLKISVSVLLLVQIYPFLTELVNIW